MGKKLSIISLVSGIILILSSFASPNPSAFTGPLLIFGTFGIGGGMYGLYKDSMKKYSKPICEFCGYIALDERELYNHQNTCEKKK